MRLAAIFLVLTLGLPGAAFAAPPKEFTRLVKQAESLYEAGKYKESAERLIEAYAYQPHPRLIYNIARAYDQAGELQLALEYYQRYVGSQEGTDPTLLKRSALSIDRIRGLVAQQQEATEKSSEEQKRLEAEAKAAQERAAKEAEAKQKAEQELRAREKASAEAKVASRKRNTILAYTFGGVAVAGLATGTVFGLQANASRKAFTDAQTVADKETYRSRTGTQALIADVGFGVGIAAAVTAVLLYPKGGDEAPRTVLYPTPGGAGMLVRF